jgi:hypothetical protein
VNRMKTAHVLTGFVAALMLVQASLGLFFRSQYRDVQWIAMTWLGNDWVTLALALPLLAASGTLAARRRTPRPVLLWLGALAYAVYNYAYYLFGAALNAFFPLYLASVIAAALALLFALTSVSPEGIARTFHPRTPVRLLGAYFTFVAVSLAAVWLAMWASYIFAGRATPVEPEAFKLVAALDSVLMIPALGIGGMLLWRRRPWGYLVTAIASVQASLYLTVLAVNAVVFVVSGLAETPGEIPTWVTLGVITSAATVALFSHAGRVREV